MTGTLLRTSKVTAMRYERARPGELVHVDVKKLGRIPDGGGWRAHGRAERGPGLRHRPRRRPFHALMIIPGLLTARSCPMRRGSRARPSLPALLNTLDHSGITQIERVITDNHMSYRRSSAVAKALAALNAKHKFSKPHCPWQNGKVERFNRT